MRWILAPLAALLVGVLLNSESRATVEEQRARLPPAAECEDSIQGIWKAHQFDVRRSEWYVLTVEIRRISTGSAELRGQIHSHFWLGSQRNSEAPPCSEDRYQASVRQSATGRAVGLQIEFGASSWEIDNTPCPPSIHVGYNPDRLTGTIDEKRLEFQSVVNDGGAWINEPVVFRRIQCLPPSAGPRPTVKVEPPPLFPTPNRGGGCSRREGR